MSDMAQALLRAIDRAVAPLKRQIRLTVGRGILTLINDAIHVESPFNITVKAAQTLRLEGDVVELHAHSLYRWDVNGHGQVWYPTKVDPWTIGETAGTPHPISPPEVAP